MERQSRITSRTKSAGTGDLSSGLSLARFFRQVFAHASESAFACHDRQMLEINRRNGATEIEPQLRDRT